MLWMIIHKGEFDSIFYDKLLVWVSDDQRREVECQVSRKGISKIYINFWLEETQKSVSFEWFHMRPGFYIRNIHQVED